MYQKLTLQSEMANDKKKIQMKMWGAEYFSLGRDEDELV